MNVFNKEEAKFLKGPQSRWQEFKYTLGVVAQFIRGFRALHFIGPCVTVFGSARFKEDHPYYQLAREVSKSIAELGFTIMTGGGPGIMEAANRGAKDVGGKSIGCNIVLPHEQHSNQYLDNYVNIEYFFVRKELLRKYSNAFVVLPGGFGTLDEFFETITLIQTGKTEPFPVIIMGKDFHQHLLKHIDEMVSVGTISPTDLSLLLVTDDVHEATNHIQKYVSKKVQTGKIVHRKPRWILGEKKTSN